MSSASEKEKKDSGSEHGSDKEGSKGSSEKGGSSKGKSGKSGSSSSSSSSSKSKSKSKQRSKSGSPKQDSEMADKSDRKAVKSKSKSKSKSSDKSSNKRGSATPDSRSEHSAKKKSAKKGKKRDKKSRSGSASGSAKSNGSFSDSEEKSKESGEEESEKPDKGSHEPSKQSEDDASPVKRDADDDYVPGKRGDKNDDSRSMNQEGLIAKLESIRKYMANNKNNISGDDKDRDELWKDDDFPPINKSLTKDEEKLKEIKAPYKNSLKWMRPMQIKADAKFAYTEFSKCDLKYGNCSDAVFTGALGLLAIHSGIENLFVDVEHVFDSGYAVFQFFKNGEWRYVVVDTYLPFSPDKKSFLYSEAAEQNEFWVPLTEKAYAKLNGCYQFIQGMDICEVLVDLTGGVADKEEIDAERYKEAKDSKDNPETVALFNKINSFLKNKYILGCIKHVPGKLASAKENGDRGIYENLYYGMMGLWEFSQGSDEPRRLMKIRNYWGVEGNWNGDWCNNHEDWDRNPEIRKALLPDQKNKMKDEHIQFFMKLTDWAREFNCWYICKVFSESWQKYSIPGEWVAGKTAGGPYPDLEKQFCPKSKLPKNAQLDTDDKWFNNPQYRIKITKRTTTIISLMQEDRRGNEGKNRFVPVNFIVVRCAGRHTRIWEMPEEKNIVIDASQTKENQILNEKEEYRREVTCKLDLHPVEGKNYGYFIIIPFMTDEATAKKANLRRPFWLRVFTNESVSIEKVKETTMIEEKGEWNERKHCGPMYLKTLEIKDSVKQTEFNPYWCQNPQYFLNISQPTHLKIILRKDRNTNAKRDKNRVGIIVCKHFEKNDTVTDTRKDVNVRNHVITDHTVKLLKQTEVHLEPPKMDKIERKLQVGPHEDYYESSFQNAELAALYFHFLPIHGPLVIMPCLSEKSRNNSYTLRIYSDKKISMQRLDESKNVCLVGSWEPSTAGGCELYTEKYYKDPDLQSWTKNPKFNIQFESTAPAKVKVTLAIAEKNWRGKVAAASKAKKANELKERKSIRKKEEDDDSANLSVSTMISIYILRKRANPTEQDILAKAPFVPNLHSELTYTFTNMEQEDTEYIIMPTTYHRGIEGQFLISVTSDQKFILK